MNRIKRLSTEILSQYKDNFGVDFAENKKSLNEITIVRSKSLKNKVAGYITKILLREQKQATMENGQAMVQVLLSLNLVILLQIIM